MLPLEIAVENRQGNEMRKGTQDAEKEVNLGKTGGSQDDADGRSQDNASLGFQSVIPLT